MNIEELQGIVSKIKYKEGWTIEAVEAEQSIFFGLIPTPGAPMRVRIKWKAKDSTKLNEVITIFGPMFRVPPQMPEKEVVRKIMECLVRSEVHESMEFFRYDDKIIFDPHMAHLGSMVNQYEQYAQTQMRLAEQRGLEGHDGRQGQRPKGSTGYQNGMWQDLRPHKTGYKGP